MLHAATVEPSTLELIKKLQGLSTLSSTRLVGGTSLALQIGHRKSIDIDLFGSIPDVDLLKDELSCLGKVQLIKETARIHVYNFEGIKLDIVDYPYPWLEAAVIEDSVRMAGMKDICAMKLAAITGRGSKKDFIDIYFLSKQFSLNEMLAFYTEKFSDGSAFFVLKSLTYFDDAEAEPMPHMLHPIEWETIKATISSWL